MLLLLLLLLLLLPCLFLFLLARRVNSKVIIRQRRQHSDTYSSPRCAATEAEPGSTPQLRPLSPPLAAASEPVLVGEIQSLQGLVHQSMQRRRRIQR